MEVGGSIPPVTVFKQAPGTHVHVRTPIMLGVIVLLVIVLSAFCYYRLNAPVPPASGEPPFVPVSPNDGPPTPPSPPAPPSTPPGA